MKILICFLLVFQCFAIDIDPIKKGTPAPYTGFILDEANLKEFKKINEERKTLKKKVLTLEELAEIKDTRVELHKARVNEYDRALNRAETSGTLKLIGGIVLGILATSAAGYIYEKSRN